MTGLDALKAIKNELQEKQVARSQIQENDTLMLTQFAFLIPKSDVGPFDELTKIAANDGKVKLKKAATKTKKANPKDKAVSEAMAMFT